MDAKQFDALVARLARGASRRDALKGVAGGALASVGVTSVASARNAGKKKGKKPKKNKKPKCKGKGKDPVTICHKGRTITVSRCAYEKGHAKHGDTLGPCPYG